MSKILIAGGTGLIGKHLTKKLLEKGHEVSLLSRKKRTTKGVENFQWNIKKKEIDAAAFDGIDSVINLAGAGIVDRRWSKNYKQVILDSRTKSADLFHDELSKRKIQLESYISASAIGYYGDRKDELLSETTASNGKGFMVECCEKWEAAASQMKSTADRLVTLRIGIVLSTKGGALTKMLPSYAAFVGSYFGDGQQYYSWIHIDDMVDLIIYSLENKAINGIYNAVAPNPVTNKTFAQAIGKALDKSALIVPAPTFTIRLAMGEMADVVLNSNRVSADKIIGSGFKFQFPELIPALKDVVGRAV